MSYVSVNSFTEYDPINRTFRQNGIERPAGFSALAFTFLDEVQQQLGTTAMKIAPEASSETPWCASAGDRDPRDAAPIGGGQVCQSGAPKIILNATAAQNQYSYVGPAAANPYFTTPSNPLREGYVRGFENWFEDVQVEDTDPAGASYRMNPLLCATQEGAEEALRLVQQFEPAARLSLSVFGASGGPFVANNAVREITMPDGAVLNAGGILSRYYWGGQGCTVSSDANLSWALEIASRQANLAT